MEQQTGKQGVTLRKMCKFITFGLDRERFGIPIEQVREIIASYSIVPLPKAPEFIEGIISLRGDIIPIVEMRRRFDMESRPGDEETRIIVIEMRDFSVGVQVDKVYEVLKLAEDDIDAPPKLVAGLKADYLAGVAEVNEKLTIILNLEEIFSTTEKIMMKETLDAKGAGASISESPLIDERSSPRQEERGLACKVSESGQINIRGKDYYVGRKYKGNEVSVRETNGAVFVYSGSEKIKEFSL